MADETTELPATVTVNDARSPFSALALYAQRASAGERAALARLSPGSLRPHEVAALARALLFAGLDPATWRHDTWQRWALIAHGIALAGHDGSDRLGRQLARAGVAESRTTRLLTARGDAFQQLLLRMVRLLGSKGVKPNWFELGDLTLKESSSCLSDAEAAERIRLRIAGAFFSAQASKA